LKPHAGETYSDFKEYVIFIFEEFPLLVVLREISVKGLLSTLRGIVTESMLLALITFTKPEP